MRKLLSLLILAWAGMLMCCLLISSLSAPNPSSPVDLTGEQARLRQELKASGFKIVYESNRDGNWELYLMDAEGSNPVNLTRTPNVDEMYPHASPDGRKICFVADEVYQTPQGEKKIRNVYYMNIEGGGRTKVAENARQPCWSPDGTAIAYTMGKSTKYTTLDYATRGIFIYDLKTGQTRQIPNKSIMHAYNIAWSPDGKWFAYTVHKAMGFGHAIVVMDVEGERIYPLNIGGCRPDWSPDGRRLAWVLADDKIALADFDPERCRPGAPMPVRLENQRVVIRAPGKKMEVYHPDWSPDGKYIAFSYGQGEEMVGRTGTWDIYVARASGGPWVRLTRDGKNNKEPDWVSRQ